MNWKIILLLSLFGPVMGIASLTGWIQFFVLYLWTVIGILCAFVVAWRAAAPSKLFLQGLIIGLLSTLASSVICVLFFDTYLQNNTTTATILERQNVFFSLKSFAFITSIPIGFFYGGFIGVLAEIVKRARSSKTTAE
jgi:hypothetical protein